jgi:hypothetical protein
MLLFATGVDGDRLGRRINTNRSGGVARSKRSAHPAVAGVVDDDGIECRNRAVVDWISLIQVGIDDAGIFESTGAEPK